MISNYTAKIAERLDVNADRVHLYWKGRVALYALLKVMGVKAGDEVILPAFTCVVVPNAIIYLGAKPVYVDIDLSTYNMDISLLEKAITTKTKVILAQNTYGLSSNLEEINSIARLNNLYTIEDCTHGFGGEYEGKPNGSYCDAAFYSTQWNKPFSTGIGGFSLVSNDEISKKVVKVNQALIKPTVKEVLSLKLQLFLKNNLLTGSNYWHALKLYRYLSKHNLVVGSSSGEEISSVKMPTDFFKGISDFQARAGLKSLDKLDMVLSKRRANSYLYTDFLQKNNKIYIKPELYKNHSFLKYPISVKDRKKFMKLAEESQIALGDWFTSPIHPVEKDLHQWEFDESKYPNGTKASKEVVNLLTDLSDGSTQRVITFLSEKKDLIH